MKLALRRVGNSLGLIVPRRLLDSWGVHEGAMLEANESGIWPPRRSAGGHQELDELKRRIAIEVLARHRPEQIRRRSLATLARWRKSGAWCGAYDEWTAILERGGDESLFGAMAGLNDRANRLRQSPPYVGMVPRDALQRIREEIPA